MQNHLTVRAARAEDKNAILAFCQNTFHWGDYIAEVWDAWLADADGQMLVGVANDQPVGLIHTAFVNDVGWMEGMRVHPAFRRQGIARRLSSAACRVAHARGCRRARLVTSIKNDAAQKMLARSGYQRVAQFNEWSADSAPENFSAMRVATPNDLPAILAHWEAWCARAARRAILPTQNWRWIALTETRLREQIRADQVRLAENGFALALAFDERDWNGITLHALVGDAETVRALAIAARGEAHYRGYAHLEATLADDLELNAALERAGYRRDSALLVYEQDLG